MKRTIDQRWIIPDDVVIMSVAELDPKLRARIGCEDNEFAVARRHARANSIVIDANAARLLGQFRRPNTIVQAIVDYSREAAADAATTLTDALPLLQRMTGRGLLVPADSPHAAAIEFSFGIDSQIAGYRVARRVQLYEDSELYQVRGADDTPYALKIMHAAGNARVAVRFAREAAILRHLGGRQAPALIGAGECDGRAYLVLEWFEAVAASEAAASIRRSDAAWPPAKLIEYCTATADGYARLHAAGAVHGDVHPRNILWAADGSVKLIDFALASLPSDLASVQPERAGVGYYFEPEYATAWRQHAPLPAATMAGEQYALAALLYMMIAGAHYLDFSLDSDELFRQIAEDHPRPFAARGLPAWPALEAVLARALSKEPAQRYPSTAEFAAAFRAACGEAALEADPSAPRIAAADPGSTLVHALIGRYGLDGAVIGQRLATDPLCSVNFGAAGIAYALYRLACVREEPQLLFLADLWSQRALRDKNDPWAFRSRDLKLDEAVNGAVSLYHTLAGVHCVQGLISTAMGDVVSSNLAIRRFVAVSRNPCSNWDLTLGRTGTLIGAAGLLEAVGGADAADTGDLRALGDEVVGWLWSKFEGFGPITSCQDVPYLGIAHGWAGVLYGTLRWCNASGAALPPQLPARLGELIDCAELFGNGMIWKRKAGNPAHERMPWAGWCHGSAGYVHLFTLAYRSLADARCFDTAERAAWAAWRHANAASSNLCCGLAGQAYAMLNLYKQSGEASWLGRARKLGALAVADAASPWLRPNSLYRGDVGIALLAAELTRPEASCMPMFESEG